MTLPDDYVERVYAGVLGKIIGVYLGRPFEGWAFTDIKKRLGDIHYYANRKVSLLARFIGIHSQFPIVITDDDIAGTFTFLRALPDHGVSRDLTPAQIGQTWLNYVIENQTTFWWGGLGLSTEHTAYLRLKHGLQAPLSGSIHTNGPIVAQQIGAQIFIDGWGMVAAGDPDLAADLARRAASVSHDGEAIYAAQVIAAMEAQAFVQDDLDALLDTGLSFIPKDSIIYRAICDVRTWHAAESQWEKTYEKISGNYGYDRFPGSCHVVPNHALVILGLLYGEGDFDRSLMVVNTAGWDTDCNSGNLGCLLGIRNGLDAFRKKDWRGPVADRLYLPTADGGRTITDAVKETYHVVNIGRVLAGAGTLSPKGGARFHFSLPGSMQGFRPLGRNVVLENVPGHNKDGTRVLVMRYWGGRGKIATPTFFRPEEFEPGMLEVDLAGVLAGYKPIASPTLYSGQIVKAGLTAERITRLRLFIRAYNEKDLLSTYFSSEFTLPTGVYQEIDWRVPDTSGQPIAEIGLSCKGGVKNALHLDYLTWEGPPQVTFSCPREKIVAYQKPLLWRKAWVSSMDEWSLLSATPFTLTKNEGRGLLIQGTAEWTDYEVLAPVKTYLAKAFGIAARVQGLRRYYALLLKEGGKIRLIKVFDDQEFILAEAEKDWAFNVEYDLRLRVRGNSLSAWLDGDALFEVTEEDRPLNGGAAAFVLENGVLMSERMTVTSAGS
jgi:ADP-ribosylglycohydrolase